MTESPIMHTANHSANYSARRERVLTGQTVTMTDGSQWFHPNNGDAPWRLRGPDAKPKEVQS